jgi:pimeloyl-ACP methyl ester carboxylesterase
MAGHDGKAILHDGRSLAYAEYGDPAGTPVLYFHGTPGGRLEGRFLEDAAVAEGVRLIALDRPGYGRSSFKQGRRIEDWPDDVRELADELGIERFGVIGLSGGGPHAQACAARLGVRLTSATIVSGAGSPAATLAGRRGIGRWFARFGLWAAPFIGWLAAMWVALWAPYARPWMMPRRIDPRVVGRPGVREAFLEEVRDALKPGARAMAQDLALFARPWGFLPRDVRGTRIFLWHGDADRVVPVRIGRHFAREIPGCESTFVPGGGHLMIIDQARPILAQAAAAARVFRTPGRA